eukprot:gene5709-7104_t
MSSSILERTRNLHESIERYELLIEAEMKQTPKNNKDTILQSHRVNHYVDSSIKYANDLIKIYEDKDNSRKDDLQSIAGQGTAVFSSFYEKLREIKDYHQYTVDTVTNNWLLYNIATIPFSGNESYGKFLDLYEIYEEYINLKSVTTRIDYVTYLLQFYTFDYSNDQSRFKDIKYKDYLNKLYKYLIDFIERTQPLFDLKGSHVKIEKEFEEKWDAGDFNLKQQQQQTNENNNNTTNNNNNKEKGRENGDNDQNQNESPLYCKACKKLFTSENVFNGHLKGKKHQLNIEKMNQPLGQQQSQMKLRKPLSLVEYKIYKFGNMLDDQIHATKDNVIKKQARSYNELEEETEILDEDIEEIDINDEPIKLRIANYPVDWSGKPIPYWVYKLYELGVEYKCEICGNQSYWGRKAYEKHFQETRHSYGMSCIGVPNTIHFHEITKIKDALELWSKIKKQTTTSTFKAERDEEYEDENGDVMSKKTFEMYVKQGLINPNALKKSYK